MLRICSLLVLLLLPLGGAASEIVGQVRVIDGDTFDVGGIRIRLHGVDAPETDQTCMTAQNVLFDCGAWVKRSVAETFDGKVALCAALVRDRYGRIVATCDVDGTDMGKALVEAGLAFAYRRYSLVYDLDEKRAAITDRGLHGMQVQSPAQFRRLRVKGTAAPDPACAIKGNISAGGVRIYHMPGQEHYDRTGIDNRKGERWFCSEGEARAAGWRKARR